MQLRILRTRDHQILWLQPNTNPAAQRAAMGMRLRLRHGRRNVF